MKQLFKLTILMLVAMFVLAACGAGGGAEAPAATEAPAPEEEEMAEEEPAAEEEMAEEEAAAEAITLEFWHAMGGGLGEVVDELATRFNESRNDIQVNVTFQGT